MCLQVLKKLVDSMQDAAEAQGVFMCLCVCVHACVCLCVCERE